MNNNILSVYIGTDDIIDWTMTVGRDIIMPELLKSAETLIYNQLKETLCIQIFCEYDNNIVKVDFILNPFSIDSTLQKLLKWAEDAEEYEMCLRVKKLEEFINTK